MYEIKVKAGSYIYQMVINGERKTLSLFFRYSPIAERWIMNIDDADGNRLITSIPLIPAQNILEQYSYMHLGQAWVVPNSKEEFLKAPSENSFEDEEWSLLWGDTE